MQKYCEIFQSFRWDTFQHAHPWKVVQYDTPKGTTVMCFHPLPIHPPWPLTYLGPVHNPFRYYTFIHMYKIYINIYIFHIEYVGKGIEPWSPWLHTNVLAIKPPYNFVKQYNYQWI